MTDDQEIRALRERLAGLEEMAERHARQSDEINAAMRAGRSPAGTPVDTDATSMNAWLRRRGRPEPPPPPPPPAEPVGPAGSADAGNDHHEPPPDGNAVMNMRLRRTYLRHTQPDHPELRFGRTPDDL